MVHRERRAGRHAFYEDSALTIAVAIIRRSCEDSNSEALMRTYIQLSQSISLLTFLNKNKEP